MTRLDKEDLAQMTRDYFQSLDKESLVEVAFNLRSLAVEQWEKLQQNSENSSKPPSSDNPYSNTPTTDEKRESQESELSQEKEKKGFSLLEKKSFELAQTKTRKATRKSRKVAFTALESRRSGSAPSSSLCCV